MKRLIPSLLVVAMCAISCVSRSGAQLAAGFDSPADEYRPWCYWFLLNGHVDRQTTTADLEAMKELGFGGVLTLDPRGYWDDDDHVKLPAPEIEFMSEEWVDNIIFGIQEAQRLGLEFTMNLSSCGGSFKGPWDLGADCPKKLIFQSYALDAGSHLEMKLENPDIPFFNDVALFAVRYEGAPRKADPAWLNAGDGVYTMSAGSGKKTDGQDDNLVCKAVQVEELTAQNGTLAWDVPEGQWILLRFGSTVIPGYEKDVDILDSAAVLRHIRRIVDPIKERVPDAFGTTLTHFYSVSWEGSVPTWSVNFESDFKLFKGYELRPVMPMLAGFEVGEAGSYDAFMQDFRAARNDMFRENFYATMRKACHSYGVSMYSECGGPWQRKPAVFQQADQMDFLRLNDMPQGEFWVDGKARPHTKGVGTTAHVYGLKRASAEAFTHMTYHWSVTPFMLKGIGDQAYLDGVNHFVWHTFSCSPDEFGVPGIEYFAGTHINRNVTWHKEAADFVKYLAKCQFMLQQGVPVVDIAVWGGDRIYQHWGHYRDCPYDGSKCVIPAGYNNDLIDTKALMERLHADHGRAVLPDGSSYAAIVVDPEFDDCMTDEVKARLESLEAAGVKVIWDSKNVQPGVLPDFEGPFWCNHRKSGKQDIYFVAGSGDGEMTFRASGDVQLWDAVTGMRTAVPSVKTADGRTTVALSLPENGSVFVVFNAGVKPMKPAEPSTIGAQAIEGPWNVSFAYHKIQKAAPSPRVWTSLHDLTEDEDELVRHFSGRATMSASFNLSDDEAAAAKRVSLGEVTGGLARVSVNGVDCGLCWTAPWEVEASGVFKSGANEITITYVNTWANRLIGDCALPEDQRITTSGLHYFNHPRERVGRSRWNPTVYSGYSSSDSLFPGGVIGPVTVK